MKELRINRNRCLNLMYEQSITQTKLARIVGISKSKLNRIIIGDYKNGLNLQLVQAMANALNTTAEYLCEIDNSNDLQGFVSDDTSNSDIGHKVFKRNEYDVSFLFFLNLFISSFINYLKVNGHVAISTLITVMFYTLYKVIKSNINLNSKEKKYNILFVIVLIINVLNLFVDLSMFMLFLVILSFALLFVAYIKREKDNKYIEHKYD